MPSSACTERISLSTNDLHLPHRILRTARAIYYEGHRPCLFLLLLIPVAEFQSHPLTLIGKNHILVKSCHSPPTFVTDGELTMVVLVILVVTMARSGPLARP